MKKATLVLAACAATALLSLSACEDGPYDHHRGFAVADDGYDVYYDDYYGGNFYDGYWGPDNYYYYRTSRDGAFVRDDAHHFRRDAGTGFHTMHMHDWRNRH